MKFQMAPNSLFAILLRSPWWYSLAIALVLGAVMAAVMPDGWRVVGALSSFPFAVVAAIALGRQWKQPSAEQVEQTRQRLMAMGWPEFSALLEQAFVRDGNRVQRLQQDGCDFEIERAGRRMLVCARRWKSARTGLEPLRALQAAREAAEAPDALYIALGELTDTAAPFAAQQRIAVWQAAEMAQALRGLLPAAPR
ncbi:MAG: restriction endonuclease [Piscinibacter sp.]|uniref:restriction endonuclease n=1 Tax=Piscinibacter sp. TaxID=1903157 RepID=UPI003D11631E